MCGRESPTKARDSKRSNGRELDPRFYCSLRAVKCMDEWLHNLPVWWMAFVVFAIAYPLVRRHIDEAVVAEWPTMAKQSASLKITPPALAETLRLALSLAPKSEGQIAAQREIVTGLENAMDARRQRIILSRSSVNWVKWTCLFAQAGCTLIAIAMVHCDNRAAAAIAMGIFATGVAVSVLLIVSHDRPFSGEISVKPDVLLQVRPE